MTFEEWKKQAIEKINKAVEEDIDNNQGSLTYDDDDMLMTADVAISDVMAEGGLNVNEVTPLRTMLATELAKGWIDLAYGQWYTGDVPKEENEKRLIAWATSVD